MITIIAHQFFSHQLSEQRTERQHWAPPQALAQNGVNVGQGWTILERRQSPRANHALNKAVRFFLNVRVENHRKDEIHYHRGCLLLLVSVAPNHRPLSAYRLSASCSDYLIQPGKMTLNCICSPPKAVAADSFTASFCDSTLSRSSSFSKWSTTIQEEIDPAA